MSDYTYNPDTWNPVLAGVVAGATAAIVAALISLPLRSPDEIIANSLTVVVASLVLGGISGLLWRRLRVNDNALRVYGWTIAGGFVAAMAGVTLADQTTLNNLVPYAAPLIAVIFITLGFLTPLFAGVTSATWIAAIPIIIALAIGVGLFGRGNVASGELSLDDLDPVTTTSSAADPATTSSLAAETATSTTSQTSDEPSATGLAASYTVTSAIATYSVEESLQGLSTQGVGETNSLTGSLVPGGTFSFTIDLQSFTSDQARRDSRVQEWFQDFPEATFAGDEFDLPASPTEGEVVATTVVGDLTVNAITHPTVWIVEARLETDGTLSVTGETDIVLSDFDVPVVTSNFVQMEDAATLEVLLILTP
ncbi:MAG: YceI family protein [Acidimicrobiia bacterium]